LASITAQSPFRHYPPDLHRRAAGGMGGHEPELSGHKEPFIDLRPHSHRQV